MGRHVVARLTLDDLDRELDRARGPQFREGDQKAFAGWRHALALHGAALIEARRARMVAYPEALAVATVRRYLLSGRLNGSDSLRLSQSPPPYRLVRFGGDPLDRGARRMRDSGWSASNHARLADDRATGLAMDIQRATSPWMATCRVAQSPSNLT